jgi:hypothetical protein
MSGTTLAERVQRVAERLGVAESDAWEALSDWGWITDAIVADEARQEAERRRQDAKLRKRDFRQRRREPGDGDSPGGEKRRFDGERLASIHTRRSGRPQQEPDRDSRPAPLAGTRVPGTRVSAPRLALAVLDDALSSGEIERHGGHPNAPRRPR